MIIAALRLFGMAAPKWMTPLVKWAIDIAIFAAVVGGLFWLHGRAETKAWNAAFNAGWTVEHNRLEKLKADYRAAYETARADNLTDVRGKEADAAAITETKQHDLEAQLADARALAADYARRMRAASAADPGSAGKAPSGETPGPASGPISAGMSLIPDDDLRICVENTVRVKGWQDWYASLRARYNAEATP